MGVPKHFAPEYLALSLLFVFSLVGCGVSTTSSPGRPQSGGGPTSTPAPGSTDPFAGWNVPQPSGVGQNPSFSYIQQNILKPKCDNCHSATTHNGGFSVDSYAGVMAPAAAVTPGDPMHSWLYAETSLGYMPAGGPPLSAAEVNDIYTWILNGAPNN